MDQHLVVHVGRRQCRLGLLHARHHPRQHAEAAHVLHLPELHAQVIEVELALFEIAGELFGLFFLDRRRGLFDQADDVAHAQDAVGNAAGTERLDRVEFFAGPCKLDRFAGHRAHRQRRTAAGIAVHAGEHHAGQRNLIGEALGDVDRVLTGERIDHQQHFGRRRDAGDSLHFGHQRFIDMQAARGIEQQHVKILEPRGFHRAPRDIDRLLARDDREGRNLRLLAEHRQLLLRGRAVDVERCHHRLLAVLFAQQLAELGGGGGLARTLQADHHDHDRRLCLQDQAFGFMPAKRFDQLVMDDLDHLLARLDRFEDFLADRLFRHRVDEAAGYRQRDIGFEQRNAHFAHGIADVLLLERAAAFQLVEHPAKAIGQIVKHRLLLLARPV